MALIDYIRGSRKDSAVVEGPRNNSLSRFFARVDSPLSSIQIHKHIVPSIPLRYSACIVKMQAALFTPRLGRLTKETLEIQGSLPRPTRSWHTCYCFTHQPLLAGKRVVDHSSRDEVDCRSPAIEPHVSAHSLGECRGAAQHSSSRCYPANHEH